MQSAPRNSLAEQVELKPLFFFEQFLSAKSHVWNRQGQGQTNRACTPSEADVLFVSDRHPSTQENEF